LIAVICNTVITDTLSVSGALLTDNFCQFVKEMAAFIPGLLAGFYRLKQLEKINIHLTN
jgi:hypothetical protein